MAMTPNIPASSSVETKNTLSQTLSVPRVSKSNQPRTDQYGGNYKPQALSILPDSWIPYIQLARLFPPAGLFLIYFPHAFGILHAAIRTGAPPATVLYASTVIFGGSFFFSNAAHIWNDLIDAELDAKVDRTSKRPIPRGAVSPRAAFVFTVTQALGAAWFLTCLPGGFRQGILYALPNILATIYYPWAKRHTHFPQLVLGFCLAWGTIMGELMLGVPAFTISVPDAFWALTWARGDLGFSSFSITGDSSVIALFFAGVVWTVIYDTIYAHQDLQADLRVGIKSLAVLSSIRVSILLLYRRTFAAQTPYMKYTIWILLALQGVYLVVFAIMPGFICHPLDKAWTAVLERHIYCNDWYYYYMSVALYSCSMAFDGILLFIPIYPIMKLHLPLRQRLGVVLIFMLGAGASGVAAYKLAIFVLQMKRIDEINPKWLQYEMSRIAPPQFDRYGRTFWIPSQVEPCVALIGTSIPALRHLFVERAHQLTAYYSQRSKQTYSPGRSVCIRGRQSLKPWLASGSGDEEVFLQSE